MLRTLVRLATISGLALPAHAGEKSESPKSETFKTAPDAILCLTSDMLPQAYEAAQDKDRDLMDQLGCFPILAGIDATRLDTRKGNAVWQVRLDAEGAEPMKAWGYHYAFRSKSGAKVDKDGKPEK